MRNLAVVNADRYMCLVHSGEAKIGLLHLSNRNKQCPVSDLCTAKADGRRAIERSEFAEASEENTAGYRANKAFYWTRQEINEPIFGTIKRKFGNNHTHLEGHEKVNGEMPLILTVYNFKRVMNILKFDKFLEQLKKGLPDYKGIVPGFLKLTSQERK